MNSVVSVASLASAAAIPSPSIAETMLPADLADQQAAAVWDKYMAAVTKYRPLSAKLHAAYDQLPAWLKSGPQFIDDEGKSCGPNCGWPAVDPESEYAHPYVFEGKIVRCVRPQVATIKAFFKWAEFKDAQYVSDYRRVYRLQMKAFVQRMREARKIKHDLGIPEMEKCIEDLVNLTNDYIDEIQQLYPTPTVMAASALLAAQLHSRGNESIYYAESGVLHIADDFLQQLEAHVAAGRIKGALSEFLENPDRPIAMMSFAFYSDDFKMPADWPPAGMAGVMEAEEQEQGVALAAA